MFLYMAVSMIRLGASLSVCRAMHPPCLPVGGWVVVEWRGGASSL